MWAIAVRNQNRRDFVTVLPGGGFGQPRARYAKIEDPAHRAPENSRKNILSAANIDGRNPALLVGC